MQLHDLIRRSLRSLRGAKARTILTSLAIAVGAFALTLTLAASNGAQHYATDIINSNFDPSELIVTKDPSVLGTANNTKPQEYDPSFTTLDTKAGTTTQVKELTDADLDRIRATSGIASIRRQSIVNFRYITRPGLRKYIATMAAINPSQQLTLLAGTIKLPLAASTVVLPQGYLSDLGFKSPQDAIGKSVTLAIPNGASTASKLQAALSGQGTNAQTVSELTFKVAAVYSPPALSQPGTELYLYTSQSDADRLSDLTQQGTSTYHHYLYVYAKVAGGNDKTKLQTVQKRLKAEGYGAQSVSDTEQFLNQLITVLQSIVLVFGLIAVVASVFGVINTMYISVLQRTREIGLMKALGMTPTAIGNLFRIEAALIGLLGGLLGAGLAIALGLSINPWLTKTLNLGKDSILIFKPLEIAALVIALMVVAVLAGLLPARRAARLDPIAALRVE